MNHFSLNFTPSDTLWYTPMDHHNHNHHQQQQHLYRQSKSIPLFYTNFSQIEEDYSENSTSNYTATAAAASSSNDNNRSETTSSSQHHHERMFEKPLTPSDVGKLNRLVIPKQHAEKYFPLAGVSASAAAVDGGGSGGGGVLLGFEDETGKCWRFRYSYWNSSQSYVLTKGWSRYVKEKKLGAGDVVLFNRHRFESDRFFIGWRRRGPTIPVHLPARPVYNAVQVRHGYPVPPPQRIVAAAFPYQTVGCFHAGTEVRTPTQKTTRSGSISGSSKKLRLFGVNLECQLDQDYDQVAEPQTSDGSSLSSQGPNHGSGSGLGTGHTTYNYFNYADYTRDHHHNHMDVNFPEDVNKMRNQMR